MTIGTDHVTTVSMKCSSEYLPRLQKIFSCIAQEIGLNETEIDKAANTLLGACKTVFGCSDDLDSENVVVTFTASTESLIADVACAS